MNESEKVKSEILEQLKYGACCRIHLHRECCCGFGLEEPALNRTEDSRFDNPFDELVDSGLIRKIRIKTLYANGKKIRFDGEKTIDKIGNYAFYELTKKGKRAIKS